MNRKLFTIIISLTILIMLLSSGCNTGLPTPTLASVTPVVATQTLPASQVPVIHTPTAINTPDLTTGLENLDFDSFVEESYRRLLLRDPETITELGLVQALGVRNDQLTNISDDYIRETQALEAAILDLLRRFDRQDLSSEQQLTLDIYTWYLDDRVRGQAFRYNDYPINPTIFSVHNDLLQFFSDIHPMTNLQDAQDYVHRLEQVEVKFEQLLEGLRLREQQGVILPRFLIPWIVSDLRTITEIPPRETPFYIVFATKLEGLSNLSSEDPPVSIEGGGRSNSYIGDPGLSGVGRVSRTGGARCPPTGRGWAFLEWKRILHLHVAAPHQHRADPRTDP